ncbi:F-box only protein 3, partial [Coemansia sp. RSA 1836]
MASPKAEAPVDRLPAELLVMVFERLLDIRSICQCSEVSRRWRALTSHDAVWNAMLSQHYVDTRLEVDLMAEGSADIPAPRLKHVYAHWHQRYRGFIDSYARIRRSVLRLEAWAGDNCPPLLQSLAPGLGWMGSESMPVRELLS